MIMNNNINRLYIVSHHETVNMMTIIGTSTRLSRVTQALSLPTRKVVNDVIGAVLRQVGGEGRGQSNPPMNLSYPPLSRKLQKSFYASHAPKVCLLRSVRKSGVTNMSGVQL